MPPSLKFRKDLLLTQEVAQDVKRFVPVSVALVKLAVTIGINKLCQNYAIFAMSYKELLEEVNSEYVF